MNPLVQMKTRTRIVALKIIQRNSTIVKNS